MAKIAAFVARRRSHFAPVDIKFDANLGDCRGMFWNYEKCGMWESAIYTIY